MKPMPNNSLRLVFAAAAAWIAVLGLLVASSLAQPAGKSAPAKESEAAKPSAAAKSGDKAVSNPKPEPPKVEPPKTEPPPDKKEHADKTASDSADDESDKFIDYSALLFVFAMATFIGLGVVARVSRLLHTPLMSLTNAISAIAIVGAIIVTGTSTDTPIRIMGAVALFASMTNVVSGFLITDRMLKMFKQTRTEGK